MSLRACFVLAVALWCACGDAPASIEFIDNVPAHPRLGEITTLKFKLLDYRGQPQAGTQVTFKLVADKPGITLTPESATSIKGTGEVNVQLTSNTSAQAVVVQATAIGGKVALSPPITFAGTTASAGQFTFQCGALSGPASGGVHAIGAYDQSRHLIAGVKVRCTAHAADRNGDGITDAQVSFLTEAGTIAPSETTKSDYAGNATVLYKTSLPLPVETTPDVFSWNPNTDDTHTGEYLVPLWMEPQTWTTNPLATLLAGTPAYNPNNLQEPRRFDPIRRLPNGSKPVNNPRDNLVTLIAFTAGDEAYIDVNNNNVHDDNEDFTDTTEPFVDSNDNGTWDADEKFIDVNGNKEWNGKNGKYDANTLIWRQERILWTGIAYGALEPNQPDDTIAPEPVVAGAQPAVPPHIPCFGFADLRLIVADPWFNAMARNSEGDGCQEESCSDNVKIAGGGQGMAFTYPPVGRYPFAVVDKLDRNPAPMTSPPQPGCFAPNTQGWGCTVKCTFTASPEDGHKVFMLTGVTGTIDDNLP